MKKILFLISILLISINAKTELTDLIQDDGVSYKEESLKHKTEVERKKLYNKVKATSKKRAQKKTATKKRVPNKTKRKNVNYKKEITYKDVKIQRLRVEKENRKIKIPVEKYVPKEKDIEELLSLNSKEISIDSTKDVKTKTELYLSDIFLQGVIKKVDSVWNKRIFHSGGAELTLILNTRTGKLEKIFIMSKRGNSDFRIDFKSFLKSLSKKTFPVTHTKNGLIELKIKMKKQVEENETFDKISILKNKRNKVYKEYMEYLTKNKGYSVKQIKNMLNGKKNTVTKNMLYAIYADYTKNNVAEAEKYYEVVIQNKLKRFIKSTEGLYLADYALREGRNKLVLEILPKFSCQFMEEPEKNYCYYYRARALYRLGYEYEIPLNIVKSKFKEARMFYDDVKKERR